MDEADFLKAFRAQMASAKPSKRTGSSQVAPQGAPQVAPQVAVQTAPPPSQEPPPVVPEVEEEVEDVTATESVAQVPDPVALQQRREEVAQGLFSRLGSAVDTGLGKVQAFSDRYAPEPVRDIRYDPEARRKRQEAGRRLREELPGDVAESFGGAAEMLVKPITEPIGAAAFAAKEAITQPVMSDLPTPYIDRSIGQLEEEKARIQQKIDELKGEARRREQRLQLAQEESALRFQGMEP